MCDNDDDDDNDSDDNDDICLRLRHSIIIQVHCYVSMYSARIVLS
jgi:hypothetical protein